MPPAYIVAQVDVHDPEKYEEYRKQVPATIAKYGGEYIARGGTVETLEGADPLPRIVIIKFDSLEKAKAWHASDEYAKPKAVRQAASESRLFVIEGAA